VEINSNNININTLNLLPKNEEKLNLDASIDNIDILEEKLNFDFEKELEKVFSKEIKSLLFINGRTKIGKKLGNYFLKENDLFSSNLLITNESEELIKIMKKLLKIISTYQIEENIIFNIIIFGDDPYINDVLRYFNI
jgi:hypothetical protein